MFQALMQAFALSLDVAFLIKERDGRMLNLSLKRSVMLQVFINKYISYLKWEVENPVELGPVASSASRDVLTSK